MQRLKKRRIHYCDCFFCAGLPKEKLTKIKQNHLEEEIKEYQFLKEDMKRLKKYKQ